MWLAVTDLMALCPEAVKPVQNVAVRGELGASRDPRLPGSLVTFNVLANGKRVLLDDTGF